MRRAVCGLLPVLLTVGLALAACSLHAGQDAAVLPAFDTLAQRLPADVSYALFYDFKPDAETGQYWAAIRERLEQNPETQQALEGLLAQFRVGAYGLEAVIEGPAAAALWDGTTIVLLPVKDEAAAWDSMVRNLGNAQAWEQETVQGKLIYHGRFWDTGNQPTYLAWTMDEDLLYLAYRHDARSVDRLAGLLGLASGATLASLDSWGPLRQRLPDAPLAVAFFPVAELASRPSPVSVDVYPPAPEDQVPTAALGRHLEALALAFTPEQTGLRIDIQGLLGPNAATEPALQALFTLPAVDTGAWDGLPADAALALFGHDASVIWPWISGIIGLDLESDLLGPERPLTGSFVVAVTPPMPGQPLIQGLPALQALLVNKDVAPAQLERLASGLEVRGAVWSTADVAGTEVRTQVGTRLSGYALSYGLDGDMLYIGTSPEIIRQAIGDGPEGSGLVGSDAFQAVLARLPEDPFLLAYLSSQPLIELIQANAGEEVDTSTTVQALELFNAMGVGLRMQAGPAGDAGQGQVEGVAYFLIEE